MFKEVTNHDRANWAQSAIITFQTLPGSEDETALCDLLADLMHWADANKQSFAVQLKRGRMHYEEECAEERTITLACPHCNSTNIEHYAVESMCQACHRSFNMKGE